MVLCVVCGQEKMPGCDWKPEVGGAKCCECCTFKCSRNPDGTELLPGTDFYFGGTVEDLLKNGIPPSQEGE